MKKLRVPIPATNAKEVLELATKVLNKHLSDADKTKLGIMDWQYLQPVIEKAVLLQQEAENFKTLSMQRIQDRNLLMDDITEAVRNARDILTGGHKKDMKKLGNWGYTVVESAVTKRTVVEPTTSHKQLQA